MAFPMLVAALALGCTLWSSACKAGLFDQTDAFIAAIKAMKHSVSPVICLHPVSTGQFQPVIDGTAFFVSARGDFITAAHVITDFGAGRPLANCPMALWSRSEGDATGHFLANFFPVLPADCIMDPALDIARCRTADDLTKVQNGKLAPVPVVIDPSRRDDGTAIAIMGYPFFNATPISSRGYIAGYQETPGGPVQMFIDRAAWPGNSGGPVYDAKGAVVGMMLQAGEGAASGISIARSGYALSAFLTAHPVGSK